MHDDGQRRFSRPRVRLAAGGAVALAFVAASLGGLGLWASSLGPPPDGRNLDVSTVVLDRHGRLLRAYATPQGRWRLPATVDAVDPRFINVLIASEDKRFYSHMGVDPLSLMRAAGQLVRNGRIVSGGSTLTMQVARLLEPRAQRSLGAKLRQMARAVQLERTMTKGEILGLYLTLAPYGGNLEGIRAASLSYFGKEPRKLSAHEAALLVALPQSPEARRPDRSAERSRRARNRVIDRLESLGLVPADEAVPARAEVTPAARLPIPTLAAHAADQAVAAERAATVHRLTIDATWQARLEQLVRDRVAVLGPDVSAAIVAVDHATGDVLARVASSDYFDERRAGRVDMTMAVRSPGSALKPFIYGLGIEDGAIHPETLIDDRPLRYGAYAPENFDLTFQGTVSVRKALQLSLNVPAVAVLETVRASRLAARLRAAGAELVLPRGEVPGLAMGLGGVGIRLRDLTLLYAGLARGGDTIALAENVGLADRALRRLLEPAAASEVAHVLLGTPPPEHTVGGRFAYKTGTSYGYRDAWAVGFDGLHTIGVWIGRADGAPVPGLTGRSAAAPLLFEAFARRGIMPVPLPRAPRSVANHRLPETLRRFRPGALAGDTDRPLRIVYPPNGALLERADGEALALKVAGGKGSLTVLVNGVPAGSSEGRAGPLFWSPDGPGFVRLTVTDGRGMADSVVVRVH